VSLHSNALASQHTFMVGFVAMAFMRFTYLDLVYVLLARKMVYLVNERGSFQVR